MYLPFHLNKVQTYPVMEHSKVAQEIILHQTRPDEWKTVPLNQKTTLTLS